MATSVSGGRHLHRDLGLVALIFVSEGAIIGSGWLFASLYAANDAGPAAMISWVIASITLMILALIHAELGGMYPVAGGSARFPHYSHGSLVGFAIGWSTWLAAVATAPLEVEAMLQYATNYLGWLTHTSSGVVVLTIPGYLVAAVLMLIFTVINWLGVGQFGRTNNVATTWKVVIPFLTVIVLLVSHFHGSNFSAAGGFAPFGAKGVLTALSAGGVVFAITGFEAAIQLAGETENPRRNIPLAVVVSMIIGLILYLLLQFSFLGSLPASTLAHGWANVGVTGHTSIDFGPFAGLAAVLGIGWLATLLYADAIVSPGGTGLVYVAYSSRVWFALSRNGYIPSVFERLSERGVPIWSIAVAFVLGMIAFLPFPGWQTLVGFITSATVLSYAMMPLALAALRRQEPERERPYRLFGAEILSPIGFIIANLLIYWAGWTTDWKLFIAIGVGFVIFALTYLAGANENRPRLDWRGASWLWPYLGGMAVISYLGSFGGGRGIIAFGLWDTVVVAAFSVVIYLFALQVRLPREQVQRYISQLRATGEAEEDIIDRETPGLAPNPAG